MRRLLIAGNWKMNLLASDAKTLVDTLVKDFAGIRESLDMLIFPPYTLLHPLAGELGSGIEMGAQDLHYEPSGAYTSGISAEMILNTGCKYVLVGHSERRDHFGDSGELLARKLRSALAAGLKPVFCLGEQLSDRETNSTEDILRQQYQEVISTLTADEIRLVTLAYEPVWAIGTGKTATPLIAQDAHKFLRSLLIEQYDQALAGEIRILYGGSVKPDNAQELMSCPDIDGALVGGASLKADSFMGIATAALGVNTSG